MYESSELTQPDQPSLAHADREQPEWATTATMARAAEWSSDRILDPGDSHDKGEPSLCVGEAA